MRLFDPDIFDPDIFDCAESRTKIRGDTRAFNKGKTRIPRFNRGDGQ